MNNDYVHLMSVYNEVEADNVKDILECEGIDIRIEPYAPGCVMDKIGGGGTDIYVRESSQEDAMRILEIEMGRGDL